MQGATYGGHPMKTDMTDALAESQPAMANDPIVAAAAA